MGLCRGNKIYDGNDVEVKNYFLLCNILNKLKV
jgi:hypothetical protein